MARAVVLNYIAIEQYFEGATEGMKLTGIVQFSSPNATKVQFQAAILDGDSLATVRTKVTDGVMAAATAAGETITRTQVVFPDYVRGA